VHYQSDRTSLKLPKGTYDNVVTILCLEMELLAKRDYFFVAEISMNLMGKLIADTAEEVAVLKLLLVYEAKAKCCR